MISDQTLQRIEQIREKLQSGEDKVRLAVGLRKEFSLDRASFILSQSELQLRAEKKFVRAKQMLFTKVGLEQATSELIANYKSSCVSKDMERYDVCCGIGGDSIGLGRSQRIVSIDRDELTGVFAKHNLEVNCDSSFEVRVEEFEKLKIPDQAFVHLDPDRRTKGRTIRPENFSPNLNQILEQLIDDGGQRSVCIKMAPATRLEVELNMPYRSQWIGHQRECKQQLLWLGQNVEGVSKCVSILDSHGNADEFVAGEVQHDQAVAFSLGAWIYEPHSAILGADLVDEFAVEHELGRLSYGSVYLTGPENCGSPFVSSFRILETCAMKPKVIKQVLNAHDIGQVEWKSRGLDQKTVARISKVRPDGGKKGVAILTRLGSDFVCYVCERI